MAKTGTASLTISELREFASFTEDEQLFIERCLDVGLGRARSCGPLSHTDGIGDQRAAYRELLTLRGRIPCEAALEGVDAFLGPLLRITAFDLAQEQLSSFSAYRFLYERLLGAKVRPWLPAAFCGAAALPKIRPCRRKTLLQSLSEAAATAGAWSEREPCFYPEQIEVEAA